MGGLTIATVATAIFVFLLHRVLTRANPFRDQSAGDDSPLGDIAFLPEEARMNHVEHDRQVMRGGTQDHGAR